MAGEYTAESIRQRREAMQAQSGAQRPYTAEGIAARRKAMGGTQAAPPPSPGGFQPVPVEGREDGYVPIPGLVQQARPAKDLPEIGQISTGSMGKDLELAARTLHSMDPVEIATIVKKTLPDAKIIPDPDGNPVIQYKGAQFTPNRPGASFQDAVPLVTALVENVGFSKLLRMVPFFNKGGYGRNALTEGIAGGFTGATVAGAQDVSGADRTVSEYATGSGLGILGGALGSFLSSAAGSALRRTGQGILEASGKLRPQAREAFRKAGLRPGDYSQTELQALDEALKGRAVNAETVAATSRQHAASDFGFDLTRGQATQDIAQLQAEEAIRQGTRGEPAQRILREAQQRQFQQADQAIENVAGRVAPRGTITSSESSTGDVIAGRVQELATQSKQGVDDAYNAFRQLQNQHGVVIAPDTGKLMGRVQKAIGDRLVDENVAPATSAVLKRLNEVAGQGTLDIAQSEIVRRQILSGIKGARDGADEGAVRAMLRAYDHWIDDSVRSIQGQGTAPKEVINALQAARKAAAKDFRTFGAQSPKDVGGKLIEQILDPDNPVPVQTVVDKIMGGADNVSPNGVNVAKRVRDLLGEKSPEWQTVQRSMVRRILAGNSNKQSEGALPTFQSMAKRLSNALDGKGEQQLSESLGADAARQLAKLRDVLKTMETPKDALNPSGSGTLGLREFVRSRGVIHGAVLGGMLDVAGATSALGIPPGAAPGAGMFLGKPVADFTEQVLARPARSYRAPIAPNAGLLGAPARAGGGGGPMAATGLLGSSPEREPAPRGLLGR